MNGLSATLSSALIAAAQEHDASLTTLRDVVCEFVAELRGQGMPLDEVIVVVRQFVQETRDAGRIVSPAADADDSLMVRLVAWCEEFG